VVAILGPACAAAALGLGRLLGAELGMVGGMIAMGILAIVVWVGVAIWRETATGFAAAIVWMFAGAMNVNAGNSVALLESGEHLVGAHVADVASWRGHERVTFADGMRRGDLMELAGHIVKRADGHRSTRFDSCTAMPIVADGWKRGDPVKLWSLEDRGASVPFSEQTFHVTTKPDDDCLRAIADVVAKHHVIADPDPIYLELVITSTDPASVKLSGMLAAAVTALVWLGVLAWRWAAYQLYVRRRTRRD